MNIQNKTFIVTGGASGLGLAVAEMIVKNGGNALIADINQEAGQKAQTNLGKSSLFISTDVSNEESVQNAINSALNTFGALHGAVNCAGIAPAEKVIGKNGIMPLANFAKTIQINLIGTFNVLRLVANAIIVQGEGIESGVIINTASVAAFDGQIGQVGYAASKGGIVAMTLPLAREFARMGIRVMTIAPGIFETPLLKGLPQEAQDSLGKQVPFPPRLGKPAEFAQLAQHIIENQMLNGEVIRLDGAIRMAAK